MQNSRDCVHLCSPGRARRSAKIVTALPFGKHKDKPLSEVPTAYLTWLARECKLSSGLRQAIAAELASRGVEPSAIPAPTPRPPKSCSRCGCSDMVVSWHECRGQRRQIRATCRRCGAWCGHLPATAENV